jgi:DNA-binding beta-propeller fold protein YncE
MIKQLLILSAIAFLVLLLSPGKSQAISGSFLYTLSNFTGALPYNWVRTYADKVNNEIYVINPSDGSVRIFNENGMEIFRFGEDGSLGGIYDVAVNKEGNLLILSFNTQGTGPKYSIIRCNYRGEPISNIEMKNLPPEFSNFMPSRLIYREGLLYLASAGQMKVLVMDENGSFKDYYDLAALLELDEKKKSETDFFGFSVDRDGNMYFTIPMFFKAYKVSPDRNLTYFGRKGSQAGRFGVISGIVTDDQGYIYIADTLRCVVMIFDKDFKFQTEFGYRGFRPGNLIAPRELEVDGNGKIYITQTRKRGVSVYKLTYN